MADLLAVNGLDVYLYPKIWREDPCNGQTGGSKRGTRCSNNSLSKFAAIILMESSCTYLLKYQEKTIGNGQTLRSKRDIHYSNKSL